MRPAEDAELTLLLDQVLDAAIELQGADFGNVQLYDPDDGTLRIVAHRGVGQEFLEHFACVDANDTSACGAALKLGQRVILEDVMKHAPYAPHLGVAARTGYRGVELHATDGAWNRPPAWHAEHVVPQALPAG